MRNDKKNEKNNFFNQKNYQIDYYYQNQNDNTYEYFIYDDVYQNNYDTKQQFFVFDENSHDYFVDTLTNQIRIYICNRCDIEFYFNNKFHKHIKICQKKFVFVFKNQNSSINIFNAFIIHFDVSKNVNSNFDFRI